MQSIFYNEMLTISCNLLNAVLEEKKENDCVGKSGHRLYRIWPLQLVAYQELWHYERVSLHVSLAWGKDQN